MFVRTNSGLSNRALFTGASYTLYVEGGGGIPGAGSSDVVFWGDLVRTIRSDLKVTVIAFGGKPELETMAKKVKSGAVTNTLVALDSDFDEFLGDRIDHSCILYTYGYSWENDAFCPALFDECLRRILKVEGSLPAVVAPARNRMLDILRHLLPWINADFWLRSMNSSLFPKASPGRFLGNGTVTSEVVVYNKEIWKVCRTSLKSVTPAQRKPRPELWIVSGGCFLHGHLYQHLFKSTVIYALKLLGKKVQVSDDLIEHITVAAFCRWVGIGADHRSEHYRRIFGNIPA